MAAIQLCFEIAGGNPTNTRLFLQSGGAGGTTLWIRIMDIDGVHTKDATEFP